MILNAEKIAKQPEVIRQACAKLAEYLNGDEFGYELHIQSSLTGQVRACAWNHSKNKYEVSPWGSIPVIDGVEITRSSVGVVISVKENEPEKEPIKSKKP